MYLCAVFNIKKKDMILFKDKKGFEFTNEELECAVQALIDELVSFDTFTIIEVYQMVQNGMLFPDIAQFYVKRMKGETHEQV